MLNQITKTYGTTQEEIDFDFLVDIHNTVQDNQDQDLASEYIFDVVQDYMMNNVLDNEIDFHNENKEHVIVIIDTVEEFVGNHGLATELIIDIQYELDKAL